MGVSVASPLASRKTTVEPWLRMWVALPFLVAVAPIVHLWSINAGEVRPVAVIPPVALVTAATVMAVTLAWLVTRDLLRSSVTVSLAWVPVLTFGYQLDGLSSGDPDLVRWPLLVANLLAVGALIRLSWRRDVQRSASFATAALAAFIVSTLPGIAAGVSFTDRPQRAPPDSLAGGPDIYFIVLDGYGRDDVLVDLYGHDNGPFVSKLEERGFYVADEATSNYAITPLSLASSLNMRYVDEEAAALLTTGARPQLRQLIADAEVVRRLQATGYTFVHFDTVYWATESAPLADISYPVVGQTEFEVAFLHHTLPGRFLSLGRGWHEVALQTFRRLPEVGDIEAPTFTFAHLLLPHPPYMFDRSGAVIDYEPTLTGGWDNPAGYVGQLTFLNQQLLALVDELLARSDDPPIIILQGDHGPAVMLEDETSAPEAVYRERMSIFSALLVPAAMERRLYPSISPVNNFRLLFDMPLLPDRSFYSWSASNEHPAVDHDHHRLRDVTDIVRSNR